MLLGIAVTPANSTIVNLLSHAVQYTATGSYSDGSSRNLTDSVQWSITSGVGLGTISQVGVFSPLHVGAGRLAATAGALSGTTGFTVVSAL